MENLRKQIDQNKDRYIAELMDLLRIPSVSADSKYKDDVIRAANFIREKLEKAGAENATDRAGRRHGTAAVVEQFGMTIVRLELVAIGMAGLFGGKQRPLAQSIERNDGRFGKRCCEDVALVGVDRLRDREDAADRLRRSVSGAPDVPA